MDAKTEQEILSTPGHLISVAGRAFARLSESRLAPLGFGVGYVPVLVAIAADPARTQRDVGRAVKIEQPSVAQMLGRMERDGLIKRVPDALDKRSSKVVLTRGTKAKLPQACETVMRGNREALAGFSEREAAQLVRLLGRLIDNLDRINGVEQGAESKGGD